MCLKLLEMKFLRINIKNATAFPLVFEVGGNAVAFFILILRILEKMISVPQFGKIVVVVVAGIVGG